MPKKTAKKKTEAKKPAKKPALKPKAAKKIAKAQSPVKPAAAGEYFYATGKRKTAVCRVRLFKGKGDIKINERGFENYFSLTYHQQIVKSPLKLGSCENQFDITVKMQGGGVNAQAEALRHGISRALLQYDPGLRLTLKKAGFLTRDARVKERKKPGLHRARRAPQFSKR